MNKIKKSDVSLEFTPQFIVCSAIKDGYRVSKKYIGFNGIEAKNLFLKELNRPEVG